ncbi:Acetyl-coenzyme A carboxylase carboxyl transferase subunit alpha [Fusobacterium sp. DD29]|uniref:acetyl-CoA carboxylase carboxyltransferase subunit alpha n=1 Tax=unclassified Fusobacterium TaxID=2648384 RepID=UPI001B8ABD8D|nr:Acetyl-coenzyme A carboxylase carboxyl transferase subunit alpha [Fusobacterium sp. DD45]MBR8711807.1 Acetyl-coenzyme A carboxylase carboxyl transferase subunit alpha [Fusobacterium sp. DD28]MBR8750223.1 Acetyl-coenzyme A carboxylase carboxyl transferase subunit alpha [Fusobacterium sp. DD29]MBR8752364.1 Acetyl-coenzyme A carboxylase carboxyl transferase subunit alpha [Fusobacterium sp. DD26]MBR8762464.1 Acetyl-coenzyme A carboxylase carboxyl transferase subunit alpha [Fusobacterium sp. DD25
MELEFEKEIIELEEKITELKKFAEEQELDLSDKVEKLQNLRDEKLKNIYKNLSTWERIFVARHPERPYTLDYIENIATDFVELHGDRVFGDDPAIVGGLCKIDGKKVMIVGHQKGRSTEDKIYRNFGMANPEGYRKALRLFKMAERFNIPIVCFIDTPGAYPGMEAEERGQGEAIARNLMVMSGIKVPIVSIVIGEGGSGGALGLGVSDKIFMLENAVYSVISPEGCAAILYKDASKAPEAAENLKISAQSLHKLGIIDGIIEEPLGGAHRDYKCAAVNLKNVILSSFSQLEKLSVEQLLENRYNKFRQIGSFIESEN